MNLRSCFGLLALLIAASIPAMALAEDSKTPASVCETDPGFSDFDFWVGEWKVYSNDDERKYLGGNSITKHYDNCLIKEIWQGARGSTGFSTNYYNPLKQEWRQLWVARNYSIDYTGGLNEDGAMVLNGKLYGYRKGKASDFRGIWTPQADGSVIQHFDIFNAEKNVWSVWFEGRYIRKSR